MKPVYAAALWLSSEFDLDSLSIPATQLQLFAFYLQDDKFRSNRHRFLSPTYVVDRNPPAYAVVNISCN